MISNLLPTRKCWFFVHFFGFLYFPLIDHFSPSVQGTGLTVAGKKYLTLKTDDRSFYGKQGTGGIVAVKTTQSVLVGIYETQQPGAATTTVEKLADYLINSGY